MKRSKRLLAVLGAGAAFAMVLAACSGDNAGGGGGEYAARPTSADQIDGLQNLTPRDLFTAAHDELIRSTRIGHAVPLCEIASSANRGS